MVGDEVVGWVVGLAVGSEVGSAVGEGLGAKEGLAVGAAVGEEDPHGQGRREVPRSPRARARGCRGRTPQRVTVPNWCMQCGGEGRRAGYNSGHSLLAPAASRSMMLL